MRITSANQSTQREGTLRVEKMSGLGWYMLSEKPRNLGQHMYLSYEKSDGTWPET